MTRCRKTICVALFLGLQLFTWPRLQPLSPAQERSNNNQSVREAAPAEVESFSIVFQQWKAVLVHLRELQQHYGAAARSEKAKIREDFEKQMQEAYALEARVRAAAIAEYKLAPNEDTELADFLVNLLNYDLSQDRPGAALRLAIMLRESGCDDPRVADSAGRAAFANNDFTAAAQYLRSAEAVRALSAAGRQCLDSATRCQQAWANELKIRQQEAATDNLPRVKLHTSKGDIVLDLFENEVPQTVGNFVFLVEAGFYDGLTFHRVLPGFMAQGGCPIGDGRGGPGYRIYCECNEPNYRRHFRGTLSMAKAETANTGGSQFFITFAPTPHLDRKHTVFGRVIEGMDVLSKLRRRDPTGQNARADVEPDTIVSAEVIRKRDHEYRPAKVTE